jgi:hypothetical protein
MKHERLLHLERVPNYINITSLKRKDHMAKLPNKPFLIASLKKWEFKLTEARRKHNFFHYKSKRPEAERKKLAIEWHKKQETAQYWVTRRRTELKRYAPKNTSRGTAVTWAKAQAGITENPPGSNRGGKITDWQKALGAWLVGTPWCGSFVAAALRRAGVQGVNYRLASVAYIEDDARSGRAPFRSWSTNGSGVLPGDLVVLFGRGVHVEMVEKMHPTHVDTIGGNTGAPAGSGSQSNGGGVFRRKRSRSQVRGYALVKYP